jgi:uncharacterized protein (DUF2267 family)
MPTTRADIIDRSVEKAHVWLNDLADALDNGDQRYAYRVLRAFLHALRDRLSVDEAAHLSAQLPIFIRGVFFEGWDPSRTPESYHDVDSFLERIAKEGLLHGETEASFAATAAASVLRRHITSGETESLLHELPGPVRALLAEDAFTR